MATFAPSYTYMPTPPRLKSTVTRRKPAPKQVTIFDKLQHIKPNNAALSIPRPAAAAADDNRGVRPGIRETGTIYDGSGDDNDNDLPTVEEILYTALQNEGFATENRRPDNTTFGVGYATAEERRGPLDDNGSAPGDNSGGRPEDSIVQLGDDDSSASETKVDDNGLRAGSAALDAGLFDSPETAIDSPIPAQNCDNTEDRQPQQEVNEDVAAVARMTGKVGDTHLSGKEDESPGLTNRDPSPEPSQDKLGSESCSDNEFNNNPKSDEDDGRPSPTKRKRRSSSNNGPTQKRRTRHLEQRSPRQHRPHSKLHRYFPNQGLRVAVGSSGEGRLPSPAPSAPQTMDTETPPNYSNPSGSSSTFLPTLTEITFRPYSQHCCSFTAVIREGCDGRGVSFSQVAQLIESIGHVGKIDDFTIKPSHQHTFLLTGFSRHTPSRLLSSGTILLTATEAALILNDAMRTRPQHGRAVQDKALVSQGSEPASSDKDESSLSDSNPNVSSDDDGCSSEAEKQGGLSVRMNTPWDPIDEQRLLAYKKEGKSWKWIFRQFPGRTQPAVRTRLNIVQARGE